MKSFIIYIFLLFLISCGKSEDIKSSLTPENQPPSITVSVSPIEGYAPLTISVSISTSDPDGSIIKTECDFEGQGTYLEISSNSITYTYNNTGTYTLSCKVTDNNNSTTISSSQIIVVNALPSIAFEDITVVSDIYFDKSSNALWLLGGNSITPILLLKIDHQTHELLTIIPLNNPPFFLNSSSEITFDGVSFYATSYGWSNGVPQSFIYVIDMNGNIINTIPCPSSDTGGFCEGLAWDGSYLWSGASDNKNIVKFLPDGTIIQQLSNIFDSIGVGDVSLKDNEQLIVSHINYMFLIDTNTGTIINQFYTGYRRIGDWDGQLFWIFNNSSQKLEGIEIGF